MYFVKGVPYWYFDRTTVTACKLIYSHRNNEGWPIFKIHKDYVHLPSFSGIIPVDGDYHYSFPSTMDGSMADIPVFCSARLCYQAEIDRLNEKIAGLV